MIAWFKKVLFREAPKASAHLARERLMVIVAHERGQHEAQPDFLPMLQKEITEVIAKYVKVSQDQVHVDFEQKGGRSVLELNITFPDAALIKESPQSIAKPKVSKPKKAPQRKKTPASKKKIS